MAEPLKILFLSAEVAPFAKTGGLGDVGGSLPKALHELGHDVRVVMPAYKSIEKGFFSGDLDLEIFSSELSIPIGTGISPVGLFEGRLPNSDIPIYFLAEKNMFDRQNIYGYSDDPYRFSFFSRAALELTLALDWRPDVIHAHDWHTAPAVTWLATAGQATDAFRGIPSLFTIHNLAHQGRSDWQIFDYLGIQTHSLLEEGYGEVNFMARGIHHATLVNTVSPTYAQEIMTIEGGASLDGLLRHRANDVHGILNGIDINIWNPVTDSRLVTNFDVDDLAGRQENKQALQARANLPSRNDIPLVAMISRLDWQKGLDITGHVIHLLLNEMAGDAQFIVLGTGAPEFEQMFAQLANYHSGKMTAFLDYNPGLAPLIYGGSDMFLMPSRFEPCGLGQMLAMRYGSVPIVRATGGLVDTVEDGISGFTFDDYSSSAFWHAIERSMYTYNADSETWRAIQHFGMTSDFSWQRSASGYIQLYEWAIASMT